MTRFISIDVETANPKLSSICQIGLVVYEDGREVESWTSLINPQSEFRRFNTQIHGIGADDVQNAPTFGDVYPKLAGYLAGATIASYGAFDRSAINQATSAQGLQPHSVDWIDIQTVVRKAWPPEFTRDGWRLNLVCEKLGIPLLHHHNALDDARAAGGVLLRALDYSNTQIREWLGRTQSKLKSPIGVPSSGSLYPKLIRQEPSADGALYGEILVFTGMLNMSRQAAADMAALAGCIVANSVTRKTTLLVVGEQDLAVVDDSGKSGKQKKAEELIGAGQEIRILGEEDFLKMVVGSGINIGSR